MSDLVEKLHWLEVASERIKAGEDETACLADYGFVPISETTEGLIAAALALYHEDAKKQSDTIERQAKEIEELKAAGLAQLQSFEKEIEHLTNDNHLLRNAINKISSTPEVRRKNEEIEQLREALKSAPAPIPESIPTDPESIGELKGHDAAYRAWYEGIARQALSPDTPESQ